MHIVVYITKDYKTIFQLYNCLYTDKKVGFVNGYGWKIITIQYLFECRFYTMNTLKKKYKEKEEKENNKRTRISKLIRLVDLLLFD